MPCHLDLSNIWELNKKTAQIITCTAHDCIVFNDFPYSEMPLQPLIPLSSIPIWLCAKSHAFQNLYYLDINVEGTSGIPDIIKEWILSKSIFPAGLTGSIGFFYGFTRKP